jgi:hypothetical protein
VGSIRLGGSEKNEFLEPTKSISKKLPVCQWSSLLFTANKSWLAKRHETIDIRQ